MNKNISDGVQKLYNCLAKGWGNVLIPQEVRGILDKEVRQINASEEEEKNLYDVIELYGDNKQSVAEVRKLYLRTCSRVLSQEMRKQENIENVISKAQEILQDENNVEKEDVNEDWLMRFFNSIQDIGNEDMQTLWGKILAGEIKNPNTFTLRSLDTLSKITKGEAMLFKNMVPYIINYNGTRAILNDIGLNENYNISYGTIVELAECGLIDSSSMMQLTITISKKIPLEIAYNMELLRGSIEEEKQIVIPIYKLTRSGSDILQVIGEAYNETYFRDVARYLRQNNPEVSFTFHNIVSKNATNVEYVIDGVEVL
ncbi:DUF2806 domain-containing protein [Lacrimispora indolis]|uniref:DUF2806 domain-containing protein n=1 Tax=Lacrimispora indolis TaxID=69825 RepID=UPI0035675FAE